MLGIAINKKELKQYAIIVLAYLAISMLFFWPMIVNIGSVVPGTGGDIFQSMWELWWTPFSIFTLHASPYYSAYLFYPLGANLATQTLAPIAGLVSVLFQPAGLAFAFNAIFLIGFVLSGLFTYLLVHHITKHKAASFVAGAIFAFSPIHVIQAFGHLQFTNIEFIPLFLLLLLKLMEDRKHVYAIGAGISFVLLTFMGDIEQGIMAIMLTLFVIAFLLIDKNYRKEINKKSILLFGEMILVVLVVGSPFIIGILQYFNSGALATFNTQATTGYNVLYSPDLLSFFIPSKMNGMLQFASSAFGGINAPSPSERTTYIGYSVLLLVVIGLAFEFKEKFKKTALFLACLILFGLLSIGPYLQVNGVVTAVPGLYQVYSLIPIFNVVREPGRFDLMVELFLAIFAAIAIVKLESKYHESSFKKYLPAVFLVLILFEYSPLPTSQSMIASAYTLNTTIPKAYSEMGSLTANFSVLVLPALPNYTNVAPNLYPGMALYYQTALKKPLVGGYASRVNTSQTFSLVDVPLISAAYYLQNGEGLIYGSPLIENYSNVTTFFGAYYRIGFVSVIKQAYNDTELQLLTSYLTDLFGYPVYTSNDTLVFGTNSIVDKAGTALVSFTPTLFGNQYSVWQQGWVFCNNNAIFCNTTNSNLWYGENPAYITIYAPNQTRVNVTMKNVFAPSEIPQVEAVYLNDQFVGDLNLTGTPKNYTFRMLLNPGLSQLIFYTQTNITEYSNMGLSNITFSR